MPGRNRSGCGRWMGLWALAWVVGVGCGDPVDELGDGSVRVRWEVSPLGCEAAGLEQVEVRLEHDERSYKRRFDCEKDEALITDIVPAKYDLLLIGLDSAQKGVFASPGERVTIAAEQLVTPDVQRLSARKAEVMVSWRFQNGALCATNGVEEVELAVFDAAYYEQQRRQISCDRGKFELTALAAGKYTIYAEAEAEGDGGKSFVGTTEVEFERGEQAEVEVRLDEKVVADPLDTTGY